MNITIKSTGHELTDDVRSLVEEKFSSIEKIVAKSNAPAQLSCEIERSIAVERAGSKYRAEGNLNVDGQVFRAEATGDTLEDAVDNVRDQLTRTLQNARGRRRELLKRGGAALKRMLRFDRTS
jgi:ribosomal subunit interface protein